MFQIIELWLRRNRASLSQEKDPLQHLPETDRIIFSIFDHLQNLLQFYQRNPLIINIKNK